MALGRWRAASPLGLRGRIVGVVLITTVATLVVAAVALLGPLEHKLRGAELKTLESEVNSGTIAGFTTIDPSLVLQQHNPNPTVSAAGIAAERRVFGQEESLGQRIGATEVAVLGLFGPRGEDGKTIVVYPHDSEIAYPGAYDDAIRAYRDSPDPSTRWGRSATPSTPGWQSRSRRSSSRRPGMHARQPSRRRSLAIDLKSASRPAAPAAGLSSAGC